MREGIGSFINYRVRVMAKGERCYEGDLLACDEHMNVVLSDAEEFVMAGRKQRRYLGLCVFRGCFVMGIDVISKLPKT